MNQTKDLSGTVIAGCELVRELGRGNNGIVYLALQRNLNRQVACKIISPDLQSDADFLDTLFAEAANAAKLTHPNVIQALDAGTSGDGINYFLMEFVDGNSLEFIRSNTPEIISTEFLVGLSIQLADALDYAWKRHKMIHGDIKPGNLMISRDGVLKIGDLGLARSSNGVADASEIMITPLYTAPEIITQKSTEPDPRSDIYSFGVMFYELACGRAPFTGTVEEIIRSHVSDTPQPLIRMNPDMDRELAEFIDSTLAKDPADRPADWSVVKNVMEAIAGKMRRAQSAVTPEAAVEASAPVIPVNAAAAMRQHTSWSADKRKKKKVTGKTPWMLPVLLILLIVLALASIPFSLGLFKR